MFQFPEMSRSPTMRKFSVLIWKFLLIKRNNWLFTTLSLVVPFVSIGFIILIRTQVQVRFRKSKQL